MTPTGDASGTPAHSRDGSGASGDLAELSALRNPEAR